MLLTAKAFIIVALPPEELLVVENTVEFPVERSVAFNTKTQENNILLILYGCFYTKVPKSILTKKSLTD